MFTSHTTDNLAKQLTTDDIFTRHRGPVTCACHVPGTDLVITSAYDGAVALFNTASYAVDLLGYHAHLVNRVSVNQTGTLAASCSSDFTIIIWDLTTRRLRQSLKGHSDDVEDFIFINDHLGASVSRDWRVLLWNLDTGAIEHVFLGHEQDALSITHLDGKLYTSGDDMTLRIWDLQQRKLEKTLGPFDTEADTCAIDSLNRRAILGCDDGIIRIFDIDSGELSHEIKAHEAGIKKVACSPANGNILSAAYDQRIVIWDAETLQNKVELTAHPGTWERSFNWSAQGESVYAGTFDGTVVRWDAQSGARLEEYGQSADDELCPGNACFNDVARLPQQLVATVSDDGLIRVGRLTRQEQIWTHTHTPESGRVLMNAITTTQSRQSGAFDILTGTHDQSIQRYAVRSGQIQQVFSTNLNQGPINCIRVADQPNYNQDLFVACYTGAIVHTNAAGEVLGDIRVHDNAVKALALHPRQAIGVSCSADGKLAAWKFSGEQIADYAGHLAIIDDVAISPNGELVASAGRDFTLKIHGLFGGDLRQNIGLGRRSPKALEFLDDNVVIVTNYWGELLRVDLRTEQVLCERIAQNGISGIAIRDGEITVSSYDGAIYLVDGETLRTLNSLRSMQQRLNSPAFE